MPLGLIRVLRSLEAEALLETLNIQMPFEKRAADAVPQTPGALPAGSPGHVPLKVVERLDADGMRHYRFGMTRRARQVLDEALKLSPEEQSLVLRELLARLEGAPDPDAEKAWAREIERRAQDALNGAPAAGDWETVCDEIEAELTRK